MMDALVKQLTAVAHGFKPFEQEAQKIVASRTLAASKAIAIDMLRSEWYQLRCCGVFILGFIAARDSSVLTLLKDVAREDASWQVQEIIAKAFDQYCKDSGYENSLPVIKVWLNDAHANVCRAVTEGLRIWTGRPYFKTHPEVAISLLSQHKGSDSEYLRKSAGNALRDISKKHGALVTQEIATWNLEDKNTAFTYGYVLKKH